MSDKDVSYVPEPESPLGVLLHGTYHGEMARNSLREMERDLQRISDMRYEQEARARVFEQLLERWLSGERSPELMQATADALGAA